MHSPLLYCRAPVASHLCRHTLVVYVAQTGNPLHKHKNLSHLHDADPAEALRTWNQEPPLAELWSRPRVLRWTSHWSAETASAGSLRDLCHWLRRHGPCQINWEASLLQAHLVTNKPQGSFVQKSEARVALDEDFFPNRV